MIFTEEHENDFFDRIADVRSLHAAWKKVRANRGAAGIDNISWRAFEQMLDIRLAELARSLASFTYRPLPAKFVRIAQSNGKVRELGILAIRDRVAQRAVLDAIEPIFELGMSDASYAFRAGRNCEMAVLSFLQSRISGRWWTVKADIRDFFGSIDRKRLLNVIGGRISDERTLRLVELWLDSGVLEHDMSGRAADLLGAITAAGDKLTDSVGRSIRRRFDRMFACDMNLSETEREYLEFAPEISHALENDGADDPLADAGTRHSLAANLDRLVDGLLSLGVANRTFLLKLVGAKALGVGGILLAGGIFAPKLYRLASGYFRPSIGILQGAPISPLLGNIYLTEFDSAMVANGWSLVRYCDDFVVACSSEAEASECLERARRELSRVGLDLNDAKSRVVGPDEDFEFLGYRFRSGGAVLPPESATEAVRRRIASAAAASRTGIREFLSRRSK